MDNYLLPLFLCFIDFCKYLWNAILPISQSEILREDKGFIPKCNLTVSPDYRFLSSIPALHPPVVSVGVKNRHLYKIPAVFKCLCRYFQNCIDFDFGMFLCQPCMQMLTTRMHLMEIFLALVI